MWKINWIGKWGIFIRPNVTFESVHTIHMCYKQNNFDVIAKICKMCINCPGIHFIGLDIRYMSVYRWVFYYRKKLKWLNTAIQRIRKKKKKIFLYEISFLLTCIFRSPHSCVYNVAHPFLLPHFGVKSSTVFVYKKFFFRYVKKKKSMNFPTNIQTSIRVVLAMLWFYYQFVVVVVLV